MNHELKRSSVFAREDLVVVQPELGRRESWVNNRIADRSIFAERAAQCADRAPIAVLGEQRTANRAGPSVFCNHGPIGLLKQSIRGFETAGIICVQLWF